MTAGFFIYFFYLCRILYAMPPSPMHLIMHTYVLLRFLCPRYATRVHPRIALLVKTITKALDDLFHFILLFAIVYVVFCLIGVTTFGQLDENFSAFGLGFGRLFDVMVDKPDYPDDYLSNQLLLVCSFLPSLPADLVQSAMFCSHHGWPAWP